MEDTLHGTYLVRKISGDESSIILSDVEISVIGEISLKIYINGIEYASLLCLNQLTEELALGFLYSEGIIDTIDDVASISYNERLFAVMINLVAGKTIEKCESLRSVTSGCGKCFTYINPLKQDKFIVLSGNNQFSLLAIMEAIKILSAVRKYIKTWGVFTAFCFSIIIFLFLTRISEGTTALIK